MSKGGSIHYVCMADAHQPRENRSKQETERLTIEALRSGLPQGRSAKLPAEDRSR